MQATCEYYVELKNRLDQAAHGDCAALVYAAARDLGKSISTVYRKLKEIGWESGRKVRADCGRLKVDEETARLAAGVLKVATRANGKATLPMTTALDILRGNGVSVASASTMARAMKRHGCHPSQVKRGSAALSMRSLHPNHTWQTDASICVLFYLPGGKVAIMEEVEFNKNKPHNLEKVKNERVIRWVVTDHFSGAVFVRYTQGAENAMDAINVLIEVMCQRGDSPFYGVPFNLVFDKGPGNMSNLMRDFLRDLKINPLPHKKGNARAKGQVEQGQNLVETQFEGRFRMMKIANLVELNAHADAWCKAWNATYKHSRHKQTRFAVWLTIKEDELRIPQSADALRDIVGGEATHKVNNRLLLHKSLRGFGSQTYDLRYIPGIIPGEDIRYKLNPFKAPAIDVIMESPTGEVSVYTLDPILKDRAGFDVTAPVFGEEMRAMPDTCVDTAVKQMAKEAYGVDSLEAAEAAQAKQQQAYSQLDAMADVKAARLPSYFPKRGTVLDTSRPAPELPPLSAVEAAQRIKPAFEHAAGRAWGPDQLQFIRQHYPDGVPVDDIDALTATLINDAMPQPELTLVRAAAGAA